MKLLSHILALFAVACLALVPACLLFTLPFHALAAFAGFLACAGVAVKINPEI